MGDWGNKGTKQWNIQNIQGLIRLYKLLCFQSAYLKKFKGKLNIKHKKTVWEVKDIHALKMILKIEF